MKLSHKRAGESTVTTTKTNVYRIYYFTKKMESTVRASISRIKGLTYVFSQLRHCIEHLENPENERSRREDNIYLGNPQRTEGIQDKGESPTSYTEIDTSLNNLQERLNAHDKSITGEGVRTGESAYTYFGDLKDVVTKKIPRGVFGIFVDDWYLCAFCNIDNTYETSFL